MSKLVLDTAGVFEPLLKPARYKGAYGGRGSGKSQFFGGLTVDDALAAPGEMGEGLRLVSIREVQKDLKQSAKRLIEKKIEEHGLWGEGFRSYTDRTQTPGDGVILYQGMQDHTADSIKSLEGFHRAWVEEAQSLSRRSLGLLRPTIRWEDKRRGLASQLWFSWNPSRKDNPVEFLRHSPPSDSIVVQANWDKNPWFPDVLEQERLDCFKDDPDQYQHIWEGDYVTVVAGAYYAQALATARKENRISKVAADPLMPLKAFWDIGVSDATSIWVGQWVGRELRFLDYYEAEGQPLSSHLNWLRDRGYAKAVCYLPHDGEKRDVVTAIRFDDHIRAAGFEVRAIKNQGKGAAMKRVEAARRLFPSMWFNEETCGPGLDAIGWYHEKRDEERNIGLGPEHDWASHGADAFGLAAVAYEAPEGKSKEPVFKKRKVL